jgi:hypothetical protein
VKLERERGRLLANRSKGDKARLYIPFGIIPLPLEEGAESQRFDSDFLTHHQLLQSTTAVHLKRNGGAAFRSAQERRQLMHSEQKRLQARRLPAVS